MNRSRGRGERSPVIAKVAVLAPVRGEFDYHIPQRLPTPAPGMRVRVPFGKGTRIGLVLSIASDSDVEPDRLKEIVEVLDDEPLLPLDSLELIRFAAEYYHHPIGEVVSAVLPALLRRGRPARAHGATRWCLSEDGIAAAADALARAPQQAALVSALRSRPQGLSRDQLTVVSHHWRRAMRALERRGFVVECADRGSAPPPRPEGELHVTLDEEQRNIIEAIDRRERRFEPILLDGVTGSGKTEVYLALIEDVISRGHQALVLIPEIGLTPQMVARFEQRLGVPMSVLHSGLTDRERLDAWLAARDGAVSVVIGTRSAVFVPLPRPGLFVVDEEHDLSYKQQEGFRYSARDLAVIRARRADVPVILGSATPSLESLHNVSLGRYQHLRLTRRAGGAQAPSVSIVDVRAKSFVDGLSGSLLGEIDAALSREEQIVVFLNRRGFAPVLICHACGWVADCARCDAHMVYHQSRQRLCCHHCGAEVPRASRCPECAASSPAPLGVGTQRVAEALERHFPRARIVRVDRDSTRRKGVLEQVLEDVQAGRVDILVGTQMLAKGHHFPRVTLVSIIDADGGLFGADFRASERLAQLIVQVAGRAGRGERAGRVMIQTHHPDHPLLRTLLADGYHEFARAALAEREAAGLPPSASLALVRAQGAAPGPGMEFLTQAREAATALDEPRVSVLGPVAAPMERRAGRYRAQLLVESSHRPRLHRFLGRWLPVVESLKSARKVRWSIDVDPQDML